MGVINVKITKKSGAVVSVRAVDDDDEILLGTTGGGFNRIPGAQISVMSRHAQGVRVMKLGEGEKVAAVAHIPAKEEPLGSRKRTNAGTRRDGKSRNTNHESRFPPLATPSHRAGRDRRHGGAS